MGLTLDELAKVARTNTSPTVTVLRDLSESQFLQHLRCSKIRADATCEFRSHSTFWFL